MLLVMTVASASSFPGHPPPPHAAGQGGKVAPPSFLPCPPLGGGALRARQGGPADPGLRRRRGHEDGRRVVLVDVGL